MPVLSSNSSTATSPVVPSANFKPWSFKIVGDNVDFNVTPRRMRVDKQTESRHYFHSYALRDRICISSLPAVRPQSCLQHPNIRAESLLPTPSDDDAIITNLKVLFGRILCENLSFFEKCFEDLVPSHINHRRSSEMSLKSDIVSSCHNV